MEDPKWQIKFTIVWLAVFGGFVLWASPKLWRGIRNGSVFVGMMGMSWNTKTYERLAESMNTEVDDNLASGPVAHGNKRTGFSKLLNTLQSFSWWTPPALGLNAGQSE